MWIEVGIRMVGWVRLGPTVSIRFEAWRIANVRRRLEY